MDIERLNSLAEIDFARIVQSENNVKYKIVIPFLQSFNHDDLDLEHAAQGSRIDINIGNRIIVETKALGVNLDHHVQQLSDYSGREFPVLAILTNGKQFRIYSPQWRQQRSFHEKIIYVFETFDLKDIQLLNRLEKVLDLSHYKSENFIGHVEEREKEILQAKKEIDEINKEKSDQETKLKNEIDDLNRQVQEIRELVKVKEKMLVEIHANKKPEIEDKIKYYFPARANQIFTPSVSLRKPSAVSSITNNEQAEIEKVKKRVPKWFNSPNQANHKILVTCFILKGDKDSVPLAELQKSCYHIDNFYNHYNAMKSFGERNHGKVFNEINKQVFLWEPVKNFTEAEYEIFKVR